MKKRLESELISIAHRILKLKNKSEVDQLYKESQKLYETLSVLKFYQDNFESVKSDVDEIVLDEKLEQSLEVEIAPVLVAEAKEDCSDSEQVKQTELEDDPSDSELAQQILNLFRPPYGRIKPSQSRILRKLGYKIIMWDILSYDFDQTITPEKCLDNVLKNVVNGSIIVFHNNVKAEQNLKYALPKTLAFLKEKGFVCAKID